MASQNERLGERHDEGAEPVADDRRAALCGALIATGLRDRAAFRRVYQLTSAKLFGICLRICGERQAAEDVLQEVYIIVWRRAGSFEPTRSSPITWLATIARNRAIDWRRSRVGAPGEPEHRAENVSVERVDEAPLADASMIGEEEAHRLRAALATLDERPRRAIRSAFLDGLTYSELATREGVPLGTMKSVVRRGLLQLRKRLHDDA